MPTPMICSPSMKVLSDVADRLAPLHVIRRPVSRLAPWFDASCRKVRRHCRRLERRYRRTCRADDRRRWVDAARCRFRLYRAKKEVYWMDRLTQQGRSSSLQLWRSLSTMLGRDRETSGTTGHTADGFAEFFRRKVDDVMSATAGQPALKVLDSAPSSLSFFRPCSETEERRKNTTAKIQLLSPQYNGEG